MKKAFLMIEALVVMFGLTILTSLLISVFITRDALKHYTYILVTQKCEIVCVLEKLLP